MKVNDVAFYAGVFIAGCLIAFSMIDLEKDKEALAQIIDDHVIESTAMHYLLDNIFLRPVAGKEVLSIPVTVVTAPMQTQQGRTAKITRELMDKTGLVPGDQVVLKGHGLFTIEGRLWLPGNQVQVLQSGSLSEPQASELIWVGR